MARPLLEVRNVTKKFGTFVALDGISFSLDEGKILGITGPNGSGKSTLINLISGLLKPDSGKILFRGKDITDLQMDNHVREGIARTFQIPQTFHGFSIMECVRLASINGTEKREDLEAKVEEVLTLTGLFNQRHVQGENLSQGCLRRLELARAIATGGNLILLDEIFSSLSIGDGKELEELLIDLNRKRGTSFLIISHNLLIMEEFCRRVLVITDGKLTFDGPPLELREKDREGTI